MSATDPTEGGSNTGSERDTRAEDGATPETAPVPTAAGDPAPGDAAAPGGEPEPAVPTAGADAASGATAAPWTPPPAPATVDTTPHAAAAAAASDGPQRSTMYHRPHHGAPAPAAAPATPVAGQPGWPASGYPEPEYAAHAQAPQPMPGGAGYGGVGQPPIPPHGSLHPAFGGPDPESGPKAPWSGRRVLGVAAATALVTSLVVGPAAAVVTSRLFGSGYGPVSSSLGGEQSRNVSTGDFSKVAEKVMPSVVSVQTGDGSGGSGVVISSDGQILTNSHVVGGGKAKGIAVQFNDGSQDEAKILGADPVSDLAVIKVDGRNDLTPATFGDSGKVAVGADVAAIGSPLGLSGTLTTGVISALDRPVNTGSTEEEDAPQQPGLPPGLVPEEPQRQEKPKATTSTVINALQTDAPINPGNSGGALINASGEVIGINTAIASVGGGMSGSGQGGSIGLGFSIPIDHAKPIAEQLIKEGHADYAAIDATISPNRDGSPGATVVEAKSGGAADDAGLRKGDVITRIGDKEVGDPDVLIASIRSHQPGDTVSITAERDGSAKQVEVKLSGQSAKSIGD